MSPPIDPTEPRAPRPSLPVVVLAIATAMAPGCGSSSASGGHGSPGGAPQATVSPAIAPTGTYGTTQSLDVGGVATEISGVVGESVTTETVVGSFGGVPFTLRHGFFPGFPTPVGSG